MPAIWDSEVGGSWSKAGLDHGQTKAQRTGSMAQVVEHLPSKHKALSPEFKP
jgi:hypothetical protein